MARATRPTVAARLTKLLASCTAAAAFDLEMLAGAELLVGVAIILAGFKVAPYKTRQEKDFEFCEFNLKLK